MIDGNKKCNRTLGFEVQSLHDKLIEWHSNVLHVHIAGFFFQTVVHENVTIFTVTR